MPRPIFFALVMLFGALVSLAAIVDGQTVAIGAAVTLAVVGWMIDLKFDDSTRRRKQQLGQLGNERDHVARGIDAKLAPAQPDNVCIGPDR